MINFLYYNLKPILPRRLQISLRRIVAKIKMSRYAHVWPIDRKSKEPPKCFSGWPGKKKFALVLTHDVDTMVGHNNCISLLNLEERLGLRSSFNFVPERYNVCPELRRKIKLRGYEVGVHGLNHDGRLFLSKSFFIKRSIKINQYLEQWNAVGFRAPAMHHRLSWMHHLNIEYDASTFDTDPFEPFPDGCGTIFPFWVESRNSKPGYVELPYTLPQDFTVLVLRQDYDIKIWKRKLDWIIEKGGMALLNTHPDYMAFNNSKIRYDNYPVHLYERLLKHIKEKYTDLYWHALPSEMAAFWKNLESKPL